MGSTKPVTSAQVESLRNQANAKGISRAAFQEWLDDHASTTLKSIKVKMTGIAPPRWGRIHTLRLSAKLDRPWNEAIDAIGSDTPQKSIIRNMSDRYPVTGTKVLQRDYILLNYPEFKSYNYNWEKACLWALEVGLHRTVPREVFAVGEQHSLLHLALGLDCMRVVATIKDDYFESHRCACCVEWCGSKRDATLGSINPCGSPIDWFLFRK